MLALVRNCLIFLVFSLIASVTQAQVVGELVANEEGVQPGARTTVALKLTHDPGRSRKNHPQLSEGGAEGSTT